MIIFTDTNNRNWSLVTAVAVQVKITVHCYNTLLQVIEAGVVARKTKQVQVILTLTIADT